MAAIPIQEAGTYLLREPLSFADRVFLRQIALRTFHSLEAMTYPSGLPADNMSVETGQLFDYSSPTDIGDAKLLGTVAARNLGFITRGQAFERLDGTLQSIIELQKLEKEFVDFRGQIQRVELPYSWYDPSSGVVLPGQDENGRKRTSCSSVDCARLVAALWIVSEAEPAVAEKARRLLRGINLGFFFDPATNLIRGEYIVESGFSDWSYGLFCTDGRIPVELGIALGQIPPEAFFAMMRTVPSDWDQRQIPLESEVVYQIPVGSENKTITVKEGCYLDDEGRRITPSWNGTAFEPWSPLIYFLEEAWSPLWRENLKRHVEAQKRSGREGIWGESSCLDPDGKYLEYNVQTLGVFPGSSKISQRANSGHDQIFTPYASFLALPLAPQEVVRNARRLQEIAGLTEFGFPDSVNGSGSRKADRMLSGAQGMILPSIADLLTNGAIRRQLDPYMGPVRQLMAMEKFSI